MALVQTTSGSSTTATLVLTFGQNISPGHSVIIALAGYDVATGTATITGANGEVLTNVVTDSGSDACIWYISASGGNYTQVTVTCAQGGISAWAYEVSTVIAFDQISSGDTGTTAWTSGAAPASSQAVEFWVGIVYTNYATAIGSVTGPSSPWTNLTQIADVTQPDASFATCLSGYQITSAAGAATYAGTAAATPSYDAAAVATFSYVAADNPVAQRGTPVLAAATASAAMSIQGTWPTGSVQTAGDLLVAVVTGYGTTSITVGTPGTALAAGWYAIQDSYNTVAGKNFTSIWVKIATGGDTAPTFNATTTGTAADSSLQVIMYDLFDTSGGTPQVTAALGSLSGTSGSLTETSVANVPVAGCFSIAATICSQGLTASATTWSAPAAPWVTTGQTQTASRRSQMAAAYQLNPSSGATVSATFTHSRTSTLQSGAVVTAQPPASGGLSVFCAQGGTGPSMGLELNVYVLTGALLAAPIGTTASQISTTPNVSITPAATGSLIYLAVTNNTAAASFTAETATPAAANLADVLNAGTYGTFHTTSVTTAGTPVLCGATNAGITAGALAAAEIKAAPGRTLTQDPSTPAATGTSTAGSVMTAAFAPPPGSLLLAVVASKGWASGAVTMSVADTSGHTWAEQVSFGTSGNGYAGIWTAVVPGAGTSAGTGSTVNQAIKRAALW